MSGKVVIDKKYSKGTSLALTAVMYLLATKPAYAAYRKRPRLFV